MPFYINNDFHFQSLILLGLHFPDKKHLSFKSIAHIPLVWSLFISLSSLAHVSQVHQLFKLSEFCLLGWKQCQVVWSLPYFRNAFPYSLYCEEHFCTSALKTVRNWSHLCLDEFFLLTTLHYIWHNKIMNYLLTFRNLSRTKKNRVPHNLKRYLKRIAPVFYITGLCIRAVIYLQSKLNQKTKKEGRKISKIQTKTHIFF